MTSKKHYPINCPYCYNEMAVAKSIMQECGYNDAGLATCSRCEKLIKVTYIPERDAMEGARIGTEVNEV